MMAESESEARAWFRRLLGLPELEMDLAEAALAIAAEEYPDLRPATYLDALQHWADDLRRRIGTQTDVQKIVGLFNQFVFGDLKFQGNRNDYANPKNSYLNEVIDRRLGIPISLSVVYIAVGERAGLPVRGVGMPGHFLVTYARGRSPAELFIDPFNAQVLDRAGCARLLERISEGKVSMQPSFLEPVGKRQILARMLNNLKAIFTSRADLRRALAASERIMLADPHLTAEWRDRGVILYHMHRDREALRDLNRYLELKPEPEDAGQIRGLRHELLGRLN